MNIAIFAYSRTGCKTARRICMALPEAEMKCYAGPRLAEPGFLPLEKAVYGAAFSEMDALIFVGAAGIAVREIAPYVRDKRTDPAVLDLDERANFVIPLLSGHIGGANALARRLAAALGATAVVTTATDVNGKFSVDTWATERGCAISDMGLAKAVSAEILEHSVPFCSDFPIREPLPDGLVLGGSGALGIYVGYRCSAPPLPGPLCIWSPAWGCGASAAAGGFHGRQWRKQSARCSRKTGWILLRSWAFSRSI